MSDDDFFASLEAEIEAATKASKLRADREAAKRRANNMRAPLETRAKAKAEFQALDAELQAQDWHRVKTVALFSEQTCNNCGSTHRVFLQYMELRQLIRKPTTQHWARVSHPSEDLPRETLIQPSTSPICSNCCEDHGFAFEEAPRLRPAKSTAKPSPLTISA